MIKIRLDYNTVDPSAIKSMMALERYVKASGLEFSLYELVKLRASQINGCAYCIDMHSKDARNGGETEQRLYLLSAWKETSFYSDRERAALAWTEALTLISQNEISDELYEKVSAQFSEKEHVALTMAIVAINGWNRLAIGFAKEAGDYKSE